MTKKLKIVHFEDDPFLAQLWKIKFEESGFIYSHYIQPPVEKEELVRLILKEDPNLIIMGIIIPGIDGYEATKILKENSKTKGYHIIGFDNLGQEEDKRKALEVGMDAYYIMAEFTHLEFIKKITEHLDNLQKSK